MKYRFLIFLFAFALLVSSATPIIAKPACKAKPPDTITIYKLAELITGAPAEILEGIAKAESAKLDFAVGDHGESIGRFQIREIYHASRAKAWGEYNPRNAMEAAIIAGQIYMDDLAQLGDEGLAICAYRQGAAGVKKNGPGLWYLARVYRDIRIKLDGSM